MGYSEGYLMGRQGNSHRLVSTPLTKYEPHSSVESEDGSGEDSVEVFERETGRTEMENKDLKTMKNGFSNQQLGTTYKVESENALIDINSKFNSIPTIS